MHTNVEIYSSFNSEAILTMAGVLGSDNNLESNGEQTRPDSPELGEGVAVPARIDAANCVQPAATSSRSF
jgi:hypothetical protein